jgi:hypothetical protein
MNKLISVLHGRMSLVSASGLIGSTKEYMYRGIQQLPLIMALTSFMLTITTGSIAQCLLFFGLAIVIPVFTLGCKSSIGYVVEKLMPNKKDQLNRSLVDVCKIIPVPDEFKKLDYYTFGTKENTSVAPSYWITSIGFIFGFFLSNGNETLNVPMVQGGDPVGHEQRYTQAGHILFATCIFFSLIIIARFYYMGDCEGVGVFGKVIGIVCGLASMGIGSAMYYISRSCGARSSDLFGVLSKLMPASAMSPSPTVCMASVN